MQRIFISILFCLLFLENLKAQDSVSVFFINLNVNIVKNNYDNFVNVNLIESQVKSVTNILKPSILIKTKKRNFREFELTTLSFLNIHTYADSVKILHSGNSHDNDTSFVSDTKSRQTLIHITHKFHWNLLKKISNRYGLGISVSNSIAGGFSKYAQLRSYPHSQKEYGIFTSCGLGLFMNYQFTNKLIVGLQKNLVSSSFQISRQKGNSSFIPNEQRTQYVFDWALDTLGHVPTILTFNLAYRF